MRYRDERMNRFVEIYEAQGRCKGLLEGRRRGRREGRVVLIQRQLTARFGPLPMFTPQRIETATVQQLDAIAERLVTAESLAAALGPIGPAEEERVERERELSQQALRQGRAQGRCEGSIEGEFQGREDGRRQGEVEILARLLKLRFGNVSQSLLDELMTLGSDELARVVERVVGAETIDDVLPRA